MASSVFFKFKSQKEPQRVTFDGTGITVFELKRGIISASKLGDGTDFDLMIYNEDTNEEYDDDTTLIPRSTSVTARRLPATKPGQGRAARYVSGRAPVAAKNSYRSEQPSTNKSSEMKTNSVNKVASAMEAAQTEQERIAAMLQMSGDQWEQEKQHMSTATPVYRPGGFKAKPSDVTDNPPPAHYICYRCGEKGHWIKSCPTNNDPTFDGKPRFKRTTGIPRSFLQTVEKPAALANDGLTDDARQPSGVMRDVDGNYVVAVPDKAAWEQYQTKAQAANTREDVTASGSKELQEKGLECSIDKRLFVDPMKTPCCGKTYCNDCIENALINSDLVCPGCATEGVLLDNLVPDEEMVSRIHVFEQEKKSEKKAEVTEDEKVNSPIIAGNSMIRGSKSPSPALENGSPSQGKSKKRPADEELENDRQAAGPVAMTKTASQVSTSAPTPNPVSNTNGFDKTFIEQMNALAPPLKDNGNPSFPASTNGMSSMGFPANMNMMNPMMGMPPEMMTAMMMGSWNNNYAMPGMNNMGAMPFGPNMGMYGNDSMNMSMNNFGFNPMQQQQQQQQQQQGWPTGSGQWSQNHMQQGQQFQSQNTNGNGMYQHQQFKQFNSSGNNTGADDDNAYMRKPVNPHRHQGRQRKVRPTDYREL